MSRPKRENIRRRRRSGQSGQNSGCGQQRAGQFRKPESYLPPRETPDEKIERERRRSEILPEVWDVWRRKRVSYYVSGGLLWHIADQIARGEATARSRFALEIGEEAAMAAETFFAEESDGNLRFFIQFDESKAKAIPHLASPASSIPHFLKNFM